MGKRLNLFFASTITLGLLLSFVFFVIYLIRKGKKMNTPSQALRLEEPEVTPGSTVKLIREVKQRTLLQKFVPGL